MTPKRFDELRATGNDEVSECLNEIARLANLVYVPGAFRCPKCNFQLNKTIISVQTGTLAADRNCDESCPNDGTPMEPVTWEHDARYMATLMPELARSRRAVEILGKLVKRNAIVGEQIQFVEKWLVDNDPNYTKPRQG